MTIIQDEENRPRPVSISALLQVGVGPVVYGGIGSRVDKTCIVCGTVFSVHPACIPRCIPCRQQDRDLTEEEFELVRARKPWSAILELRQEKKTKVKRYPAEHRMLGVPAALTRARPDHDVMTWVMAPQQPLLLCGPVGRGKSWQAVGAMHAYLRRFYDGYGVFLSCSSIQRMDAAAIQQARTSLCLVLDDLGSRLSPGALATAFELIDHRTGNLLPLIVTTNLDRIDIMAMDERIASRLNGTWLKLTGPDRRSA